MGICCALASFAGVLLTGKVSEKTMMLVGAILFFFFAFESGLEARSYYKETHSTPS
jgi:putative Ca2+/H+ antiporter (TMEM165/GDT1 family)